MFVYVGVDKENFAVKVGITNTNGTKRLKNHNQGQDMFYFELVFEKEFTKETAQECEKKLLGILRKKYDHVDKNITGKTETFVRPDDLDEVVEYCITYIQDFTEERAEEYARMRANYNKYTYTDVQKFLTAMKYLCGFWHMPYDDRVQEQTLHDLFHCGLATEFYYEARKDDKLLTQTGARNYMLTRQEFIPYNGCEEHY